MSSFVYFIKSEQEPPMVKIGKANNAVSRLRDLQIACPSKLTLLGAIECENDRAARDLEATLHNDFYFAHNRGEWFHYNPEVRQKVAHLLKGKGIQHSGVRRFRKQRQIIQPPEVKKRRKSIPFRMDAEYRRALAEKRGKFMAMLALQIQPPPGGKNH